MPRVRRLAGAATCACMLTICPMTALILHSWPAILVQVLLFRNAFQGGWPCSVVLYGNLPLSVDRIHTRKASARLPLSMA